MSKLWQLMEFLNKKDPRWNGDRNTEKNRKPTTISNLSLRFYYSIERLIFQ